MRGDRTSRGVARNGNATLQQEGTDLVDDAGALPDQPLPHPVERLQVELLGGLVATNFIVGRCIASAIASASRKSFSALSSRDAHIWLASAERRDQAM